MNINSASGFPTPKTVCVREQARCGHFVQTRTRSRIGASRSALFGTTICNRASAILEAHGKRSLVSRIFSSAAITRSRAGSFIEPIIQSFARACKLFHDDTA